MPLVYCPSCNASLDVKEDRLGTQGTCPKCAKKIILSLGPAFDEEATLESQPGTHDDPLSFISEPIDNALFAFSPWICRVGFVLCATSAVICGLAALSATGEADERRAGASKDRFVNHATAAAGLAASLPVWAALMRATQRK